MTPRVRMTDGHQLALLSGYRGVTALRWLGIVLLLGSALTTPAQPWLPGTIGVAVIASGYNLGAMELQRRGEVSLRVRATLLCADFVGCLVAMLSMMGLTEAGAGPAESIGLLLVGVEAVVLFDMAGYVWFCVAAPPALALAAWDQARVMNFRGDPGQWAYTWAVFLVLLWLIALRGRQDSWLRGELRRLAATDDLTGLSNRRSFRSSLTNEVARARRSGRQLCLLMLDLDHFKDVNDTFGHGVGDRVLANVGDLLASGMHRAGVDVAARVGGEEFAVILPDTDEAGGLRAAERLRLKVESRVDNILTTMSVGVAVSHLGDDVDSLLGTADMALYAAKAAGRNCVRVAGDGPGWEAGAA
ncbi:MAG: GGDEF domain-containing protein [Candidatus Dormibacteraeota bacterium]|nr:GGDEF domain-containing protein [Candidatus Dormibacteraeota bacterium]